MIIRAARGTGCTARSWQTEAALRMLYNNLDPDVAERPADLVVYGGTGRAARDWPSFHAISRELTALSEDETLLVLGATVGEDVGVTLAAGVWMSKAPPGVWGGAFVVGLAVCCSPCRHDRFGLFGGDLGDGGAGGGLVDDGLVGCVGGDEGL